MFFITLLFPLAAFAASQESYAEIDLIGNTTVTFPASDNHVCSYSMYHTPGDGGGFISSFAGVSCVGGVSSGTSGFLEDGWNNGAANTPDGSYIVRFYDGLSFAGDDYYILADRINGNWVYSGAVPDPAGTDFSTTRFTSTFPEDEDVVIDPLVQFSASWFISAQDLDDLDTLFSGPAEKIRFTGQILDLQDSTWSLSVADWVLPTGFETSTTTGTFIFNGSQYPQLNYGHNYKLVFDLVGSNYFNVFGPIFSIQKTIYFSVGTTTHSGALHQFVASTTAERLKGSLFRSGYSALACNPISGDFNITDCLLSMVQPDPDFYPLAVSSLKSGFLSHAPMGYITRFVGILSATTTTTLPAFTVPIRIGESTTTDTLNITYDMNDMVAGAGTLLENTRDPYNGKNLRDIFEPIVQLLVALALLLVIIKDILGSHKQTEHDVALRK